MKFDVPSNIINKLFEQGFENQILDIVMACENEENTEVSDIPISPIQLKANPQKVIILPKVYEVYLQFVKRIKNENTAQEIPFFLLGNTKEINHEMYVVIEDIVYDIEKALSCERVQIDESMLRSLLLNNQYTILSIGHTHGNIEENKKNTTLARTLPIDLKEKYELRDTGLNISIADIWQHEVVKDFAKFSGKEIMQTIIMYNGDIIMISAENMTKINDIQCILQDGKHIPISSGSMQDIQNTPKR